MLSFAQQRLWFLDQFQPGATDYIVRAGWRLSGALDVGALEAALGEVVARHEVLRTVIAVDGGRPCQVIRPPAAVALAVHDLSCLGAAESGAEAARIAGADAATPFDLQEGPLLRAVLVRLGAGEHVLGISMHHIASDGWSMGILAGELSALYGAFAAGRPSSLAPLAVQYADYAAWQREWLTGEVLEGQLEYWRQRLAGAPPALGLATDHPRPAVRGQAGAAVGFTVGKEVADSLRRLGREHGATMFMTLLAAFQVLLGRYAGTDDVIVGSPVAGRVRAELEGLIGFFVNTLVLRTDCSGDPGFAELLGRVRETALGAYEHQDLPFEKLVEELAPVRDPSFTPLFQVLFVLQNAPGEDLSLDGLEVADYPVESPTARFDLELSVAETSSGLAGWLNFSTELFEHATAQRMVAHFQNLLCAIAADPGQRLSELEMLGEQERRQLLVEWNATAAPLPDTTIAELFEARAAADPQATAVTCGAVSLSYGQLNTRANQLARRLQELGVGPECVVGVCLPRGTQLVVALLAVLKAGAAYLPLDRDYPPARLRFMVADSGVPVLVTAQGCPDPGPGVQVVRVDDPAEAERIAGLPAVPPPVRADPGHLAYVIYTSGSTGQPKGVMVEQSSVVNVLAAIGQATGLTGADTMVAVSSASFDIAAVELILPLMAGATVVVASSEQARDPQMLAELISGCGASVLQATPATWSALTASGWANPTGARLLCGGEALGRDLGARLAAVGNVINVYGPAETTIWSTAWPVAAGGDGPVPIGRPIANTQLYVLDRWSPVPVGVAGELFIGGAGVARGYLGRPELTAERFVPDPCGSAGGRLYRTGDLVRWRADGVLEFLGRSDHQVKVRGYRVELGEIEVALRSHPRVRDAVVVVREDVPGDRRLAGYVITEAAEEQSRDEAAHEQAWRTVWDAVLEVGEDADPAFDTSGWVSSYTEEKIPATQMREWVEISAQRIRGHCPRRVLEIGCGSGLILWRVAPACERYVGIDFSRAALDSLRDAAHRSGLDNVELIHSSAADFSLPPDERFDVVVLNSVVQYFPTLRYLQRVLRQAADHTVDGGLIYLGDLRNLALLDAFSLSVERSRSGASNGVLDRANRRSAEEIELVLHPAAFAGELWKGIPSLTASRVLLRDGRSANEMSRFRYDVMLYKGLHQEKTASRWLDWSADIGSVDALTSLLAACPDQPFGICGIPNARVAKAVHDLAVVRGEDPGRTKDAAEPEDLRELAAAFGFGTEFSWGRGDPDGSFDALFVPVGSGLFPAVFQRPIGVADQESNSPLRGRALRAARQGLPAELREWLRRVVPEYMVPTVVMVVEGLPLSPNGKLDRKALPVPAGRPDLESAFVAPRTPAERAVAAVWADVLGLAEVGIHDNFFDLGGHSLLATRVVGRLRDELGAEVAVQSFFAGPTVAEVAAVIDSQSAGPAGPSIGVASREGELELSFAQQRLWFLDQFQPGATDYIVRAGWRLSGALDVGALEAALGEVVARHEVLRTVIAVDGGRPCQVIRPPAAVALAVHDLSCLGAAESGAEAARIAGADAATPFDLQEGPLLRAVLVRLGAGEHVLGISMHHIASDGWSMGILAGELSALYGAFAAGRPSSLAPLAVQYADYAAWQREWLTGEVLEGQLEYWRQRLAGAPPALGLATDHPRPAVRGQAGAAVGFTVGKEVADSLRRLGREHGATMFMTLLAAFQVLLGRYAGTDDVIVGSPVAGRVRAELEGLIGFFVNTLVLRTDCSGDPGFAELLGRVRETALGAYEHQDLPFEKLVEELAPVRDPSFTPLFQVLFVLQNAPGEDLSLDGLEVADYPVESPTARFDLELSVAETSSGLAGWLNFSTELFEHATAQRMVAHFQNLLCAIAADPGQRLSELEMLGEQERRQLLVEWNATAAPLPDTTIAELFEARAAADPQATAVTCGAVSLSYGQLNTRANQLARRLQELGVGPEALVAICLDRSAEMVVAQLGVMKAGGAYVPLDPAYPSERLAFMISDSAARVLVTTSGLAGAVPCVQAATVCLDDQAGELASLDGSDLGAQAGPHNLAYVIYTSGSTGQPKGVMVEQSSVVNLLSWYAGHVGLQKSDRATNILSPSFDASVPEIYVALISGATLVIVPDEVRASSRELAKWLEDQQSEDREISVSSLPTALADAVLAETDQISLRVLVTGGDRLRRRPKATLRATEVLNTYGPTECTVCATVAAVGPDGGPYPHIGRPIANTEVYILDRWRRPVPVGVPGEIYIGGAGLARGYLNRPELTAERFVSHPFSGVPGARLYRSGDLARFRPDGNIEFLGRTDHQVKVRGFRIECGEVEATLAACPGVAEAVVVAREDVPGDQRLVAYLKGPEVPGPGEARAWCARSLPDYMVPSAFVVLEEFPLSSNGKLDRKALPVPAGRPDLESAFVAPRTPAERAVAAVWADVLGLAEVGIHDNFFDLGGHSLLATRVVGRLRDELGAEVAVQSFFAGPTVAEVAAVIDSQSAGPAGPSIGVASREGELELSFAQQRLWFLDQFQPGATDYIVRAGWRLSGALDVGALEAALGEVVARHEVLRTVIAVDGGRPCQVIRPPAAVALAVHDLSCLGAAESGAEAARIAGADAATPFDLQEGPLLRAVLVRLGAGEHVLGISMHHIASDGWSMGILAGELSALYGAFAAGRPSSLAPLAVQYADYAAWQREWLTGEVLEGQLEYWRQRLAGAPPALGLATDHPRPAVRGQAGAAVGFTVGKEVADSLRRLGREHGATMFMTLLAAFQVLLGRYAGTDDVIVGSPVAGRVRAELEGLIGFFVNTLVLRTDCSGDPGFAELLGRVRETALGAYEHQDLPFEKLVEELAPVRDPSFTPLFQVLFVLQNAPGEDLSLDGLEVADYPVESPTARFDLELSVAETSSGLAGWLNFSTELFEHATAQRMVAHFQNLLCAIAADPGQRLSELEMLGEQERRQLLVEWNATAAPLPDTTIAELFEARAAADPQATAVTCGAVSLSYGQLNTRANQLARRLQELGVGPEALVAICLDRSAEMVVAQLGVMKAGGAYVPLDPAYPSERLAFMISDSAARVLVTTSGLAGAVPCVQAATVCLDDQAGELASLDGSDLGAQAGPHNLAYVIYTSGSTGQPKGVMVEQSSVVNLVVFNTKCQSIGPQDRHSEFSSPSFDESVREIYAGLISGATLVIVPDEVRASSRELAKWLEDQQISVSVMPTALADAVLAETDQISLRVLVTGGDRLRRRPKASLGARVMLSYGPTEATVYSTVAAVGPDGGPYPHIGRPIANTEVYILDRWRRPVPVGVPGEIYIGGAGLARGYLNRPELTAERFVSHPFSGVPGARLYRSGDLARFRPDGNIEFLGRTDHQVKVRGFRIECGEVEATLAACPGVAEAVVVAREDVPGDQRLVAYLKGPEVPGPGEARAWCARSLPDYMVPSAFVVLEEFPLSSNGKLDRKALPVPAGRPDLESAFVAPRTPAERAVAAVWADVLGLAEVGIHDNFFDLGGHSLLATRVVGRLRDELGAEVAVQSFFAGPTVAEVAAVIDSQSAGPAGPSIGVASREGELELSFAQQRLWFLDQFQPGATDYIVRAGWRLSGALDVGALEAALGEVVARHEVLRTVIAVDGGRPCQVIRPPAAVALAVHDLSCLGAAESGAEAARIAGADAATPFDLQEGPLLRAVLVRLGAGEHVLGISMHHIASDGWSMGILAGELSALYGAFAAGRPSSLAPLAVQYADYAAWQREWLTGEVLEGQLEYWRQRLAGAPPALGLATDHPRPAVRGQAGAAVGFTVGKEVADSLRRLGREHGATMFMTLLAAFQVLLGRYAGTDDVIVGSPVAGRVRAELEGLIGFFVNTLVLRTDCSGDPGFAELLGRVRETALGAYEHQDLPFEKLVEELAPVRDPSFTPLFQVLFVLQNAPGEDLSLDGLEVADYPVESPTARFDLELSVAETSSGLAGWLNFSTELFEHATAQRMVAHFQNLLCAIAADPGQRLSELEMLGEQERRQLLVEWNATAAPLPDTTIAELFEARAAADPQATAVTCGAVSLSYGQLNTRANQLARRLQELGVGPECVVGVCLPRGTQLVVALLAVLKAGAAYLPLDRDYPPARLRFMVADSGVPVLVTAQGCPDPGPGVQVVRVDDPAEAERIAGLPAVPPPVRADPGHLAYVIYTSGSTGQPKGVMVEQSSVVNLLSWYAGHVGLQKSDRATNILSPSFDASVPEIYVALISGATLVIVPDEVRASSRELAKWLEDQQISVSVMPTALADAVLAETDQISLRVLVTGGDRLRRRPKASLGARTAVVYQYGPTECTVCATVAAVGPDGGPYPHIGRPIANTEVYILDRWRRPVPVGVPGEIYIGGAGLARGYLNRPELTAERFVSHPFSGVPGARLYRSGDLARFRPDGNIEFLGRTDHQVKVRGFRIECGEVEATLAACPGVAEAVVVAREDVPGDQRLVAYLKGPEVPGPGEARAWCARSLPDYMVPSAFVVLEEFPLSSNGKLDRKALPVPAGRPDLESAFVAPRTPAERAVAAVWADVLGLAEVGIHDNFFDLGGHSLRAIQLISRANIAFGCQLPVSTVFTAPTVAAMADIVRESRAQDSNVVPLRHAESGSPVFCVHPSGGSTLSYWKLARLLPENRPVLGVESWGLHGRPPHQDLHEMAENYAEIITAASSEPPTLIGWSSGGRIALETARVLRRQGCEVAHLVIIDCPAPRYGEEDKAADETQSLTEATLISHFAQHYELELPTRLLTGPTARDLLLKTRQGNGYLPPTADEEQLRVLFDVYAANMMALQRAGGSPSASGPERAVLDYPVLLVRAEPVGVPRDEDRTWGWRSLVGPDLTFASMEADHYSIMRAPAVSELAKLITQALVGGLAS